VRITVTEVARAGERSLVRFAGEFGSAAGMWVGDVPVVGADHDVEFTVDAELRWGRDIEHAPRPTASLSAAGDVVTFVARARTTTHDPHLIALDFDGRGLLDVELESPSPPIRVDGHVAVRVPARSVQVYPSNG
jgi:hypothetical protein